MRAKGAVAASLVIGIGNPLRGDDGIGWRLAAGLAARPGLAVRCQQQLTPELAAELAAVERLLLLDAWLEPPDHRQLGQDRLLSESQPQFQQQFQQQYWQPVQRPLQLQEIGLPDRPGRSLQAWTGAAPWNGASHGLSPQALLALSQILFGQAPRTHQLLLPARCFGHGQGLSPSLARRLPEARRLITGWIAAREGASAHA